MRNVLTITAASIILMSCERPKESRAVTNDPVQVDEAGGAMIRTINVNVENERIGIELNGEKARLILNPYSKEREYFEISYPEGLALLERFYEIKNVEKHRGKPSDSHYESKQYIVNIFDEMPAHYSEDWVCYVYPKNESSADNEFSSWLQAMQSAKDMAQQDALE